MPATMPYVGADETIDVVLTALVGYSGLKPPWLH